MLRVTLPIVMIASSAFVVSGCSQHPSEGPSFGSSSATNSGSAATSPDSAATSSGSGSAEEGNRSAPAVAPASFSRPPLVAQTGQYFTWTAPADWKATETANGVDLASPDGTMIANSAVLVGNAGQSDPWSFLSDLMTRFGARDLQRINTQDLPPLPSGYPGINWQIQEFEVSFTDSTGSARHGDCTIGILNAYGGYSVAMQSFSTPPDTYAQGKTWLPILVESIKTTDPSKLANQNQVLMPRNHPLDNSGLMESWQERRLSQDRIAKAQHEGMMGYERMVSPTTGTHYNMPLETYDGTVGGYRNPDHPNEILNPTQPGE